ncbi:hypothetical protein CEUSTIGMA_g4422.t1 [Chlamydomonas eustigma]|uniref:ABC transporter domain-containing protein n=1 Tax=Chlamydomonas eustigma TaxID=1157962 RepID=A0A250X1P3_9CHLO|nr:hypothetical protein CEUSTIGMA_g4422.t1 [Chlamydomonas eustigma]|eukprot:GAX76975.1 hypothetical protein CEUSTIGMA_g4422.t1 [Chlamydomonas eustigma]
MCKSTDGTVGVQLDFKNLECRVRDRVTGQSKQILFGISGSCVPGRLFALMGGSGAGKTTLLNILACNTSSANVCGDVAVNGCKRIDREFSKSSCYVMQADLLYPSATVRECVLTSALLRLPMRMSRQAKILKVDEVLKDLLDLSPPPPPAKRLVFDPVGNDKEKEEEDLLSCANTLIGDDGIGMKGISGGQKRRTSLATDLVKDPLVIFADEPTSGLDSEVALNIMEALLMLSRKNRTVVCTIHQPNSDITSMFEDFMLLSRGRCVYHGPWLSAVDWFAGQGFRTPNYKNPTDYFMSVIRSEDVSSQLVQAFKDLQLQACCCNNASAGGLQPEINLLDGLNYLGNDDQEATAAHDSIKVATVDEDAGASCPAAVADVLSTSDALQRMPAAGVVSIILASQSTSESCALSQHSREGLITMPHTTAIVEAQRCLLNVPAGSQSLHGAQSRVACRSKQQQGNKGATGLDLLQVSIIMPALADASALTSAAAHQKDSSLMSSSRFSVEAGSDDDDASSAPIWYQVNILSARILLNWFRSPVMLASEIVQYLFMSIFIGLMYFRFTDDSNGVYNRASCVWFSLAVMCFTPSYTAATSWHVEKGLIRKELQQRQYSVLALCFSRSVVTLPFQLLQCLLFVAVMYFLAGFQADASKFFIFWVAMSLFQILSDSVGLLCAIVTKQVQYSTILLTFVLLVLLSFSGFLLTQVPVYFVWINKISYLTYAYTGIMQSQLSDLMVQDPNNSTQLVQASTLMSASLNNGLSMSANFGVLAAICVGMELMKLGALQVMFMLGML